MREMLAFLGNLAGKEHLHVPGSRSAPVEPSQGRLGSRDVMTVTPWGDSRTLRDRQLRPGSGPPREEVVRNQRERLFGAMVTSVAERGFEATRVADLAAISGVSSRTFYDLFTDKRACYLAAIEAMIGGAIRVASSSVDVELSWEEQARRGLQAFAGMIVDQPAAARMFLLDAHAAGPEVVEVLRRAEGGLEQLTREALARSPLRAQMPPEIVSAYIGAIQEIARAHLRQGTEAELPELLDELWLAIGTYRPPPVPLKQVTRRPTRRPVGLDTRDQAKRALEAFAAVVAEKGYASATVDRVVERASMSTNTFYAHFKGKEDAMLAVVDSAGAQIVAAVMPAFGRASEWTEGVRAGFEALFNYLSARPDLAKLMAVEIYVAGLAALECRDKAIRPLGKLFAQRWASSRQPPTIAVEAFAGGVYALAYRQTIDFGADSLSRLAPICTYMALAPFIGAEQACAVVNGDGR